MKYAVSRWMRSGVALVLACLALGASAQSATSPLIIDDPEGDVAVGPTNGDVDHLDLVRFSFEEEDASTFVARIEFVELEDPWESTPGFRRVEFGLEFRGQTYVVRWLATPSCGGEAGADIYIRETGGQRLDGCARAVIDAPSNAVSFFLERKAIVDGVGLEPRHGDAINITYVQAWAGAGQVVEDHAPNDGIVRSYTSTLGARGEGYLRMKATDPLRASNGAATTIVYEVELHSEATTARIAALQLIDLPTSWDAFVPPLVSVEPGGATPVPVVVSIPFAHQHGTRDAFVIRATDLEDENVWVEETLGVEWIAIPQPAGHHEDLYLHSRPVPSEQMAGVVVGSAQDQSMWINTLSDDPDPTADDAPVPGYVREIENPVDPESYDINWWLPLSPELRLGLSPDMSRTPMLNWVISGAVAADSANVGARIMVCDPTRNFTVRDDGHCPVGGMVPVAGGTATGIPWPQGLNQGEIEMPYESGETIPYRKDGQLFLHVSLIASVPQNAVLVEPRPELHVDDMHLFLPLHEYQDPVPDALASMGEIRLENSLVSQRANPGTTAQLQWTIQNAGTDDHVFGIQAVSPSADWLELPKSLSVPAGSNRTLQVLVAIPANVPLQVHSGVIVLTSDTHNLVARYAIDVVDAEDEIIPGFEEPLAKKSPIGATLLLLALMAMAGMMERGKSRKNGRHLAAR